MENLNEEKPIKKSKKGLVAILAIIIIAILVGIYCFYNSSSKANNIFVSQINKAIDNMSSAEEYETLNATVALSGKIETEDENIKAIADYINDSKLILNVQADSEAKKESLSLDIDYQNESLMSGKLYYASGDDNIYLYVDELFDKYFKINLNDLENSEETISELEDVFSQGTLSMGQKINQKKAITILKKEIKEKLKPEYFSQEKVDGMKRSTMKLTIGELKKIVAEIATDLKDNEEFLNCYENQDDIKTILQDAISAMSETEEYDNYNIAMSIYTKGLFSKDLAKFEFTVSDDQNQEITFNINKIDDENYEFYMNFKFEENNMNANVDTLKGTLKIEEVDKNTTKCTINADVPDLGKITLNVETKVTENTDLDSIDVSNSVDVNKLTEDDVFTIYTNLQNMKIFSLIAPMFMY